MIEIGLPFALMVIGLLVLMLGADQFVKRAAELAAIWGLPPLLIGLTVVAFGTSLPELMISLDAAVKGAYGIAVGNVVGSNIANILLILGFAGLIRPIAIERHAFYRDGMMVMAATVAFIVFGLWGALGWYHGMAFLAGLTLYIAFSYRQGRRAGLRGDMPVDMPEAAATATKGRHTPYWKLGSFLVIGLIGVIIGAELMVNGAVEIARELGVSDEVIGLTLVAFGTSVPELATAIAAARRGQTEMILGNILGSNLFNTLAILGTVSIIIPVQIPEGILRFDFWIMLAATVALLVQMRSGWRLSRPECGVFLAMYLLFVGVQFLDLPGKTLTDLARLW